MKCYPNIYYRAIFFACGISERIGHYTYPAPDGPQWGRDNLKTTRDITDSFERFCGREIHITEFNTSWCPRTVIHDTNFNAAYIAHQLSWLGDLNESYSYWTFGDVFKETGVPFSMFHGGFGLVANGCVPKPTFWTFKFYKNLKERGTECAYRSENTVIMRKSDGGFCGTAWNFSTEGTAEELMLEKPNFIDPSVYVDYESGRAFIIWGNPDPYLRTEAETIAFSEGLETDEYYTNTETGALTDTFTNDDIKNVYVTGVSSGNYIKVANVDFGSGAGTFTASVASAGKGGEIELRLDSKDGSIIIGTLPVSYTGGNGVWQEKTAAVSGAEGVHDLYLVFKGEERVEDLFDVDHWRFTEKTDDKTLTAINASIDEYKIDIRDGANTANMTITAVYSDGTSEDVTSQAQVTSENVTYNNGVITGTSYGDAVINVSYGGVSEQIRLQVKDMETEEKVESLSVEPATVKLVCGGTPADVTVTAVYEDGHTEDVTLKADYTSADTSVVSAESGMITPVNVGSTNVTVSFAGRLGEAKQAVIPVTVTSNMIINGDLETGSTEPWVNYYSTLSVEDEGGNKILKVSDRVSDEEWEQGTANGAHYTFGSELQTGKTYRYSARLKYTEGPDTRDFAMVFWNGWQKYFDDTSWGDEYGGYNLQTVTAAKGEWVTFSGTVTIPEGADLSDEFALGFVTTWTAEPTAENDLMDYYIDDVTFADIDSGDVTDPDEPLTTVSTAERIGSNIVLTTTASEIITDKVLHIALYASNDTLVRYIQVPTSESEKTAYVVFEDDMAAEYAKVFVWDSIGQMTPSADAETVEIQ